MIINDILYCVDINYSSLMVGTVIQCRIKKNVQRLVSDPGFIFADFIVSTATLNTFKFPLYCKDDVIIKH